MFIGLILHQLGELGGMGDGEWCDSEALPPTADRVLGLEGLAGSLGNNDVGAGLGAFFVSQPITLVQNPPLPKNRNQEGRVLNQFFQWNNLGDR